MLGVTPHLWKVFVNQALGLCTVAAHYHSRFCVCQLHCRVGLQDQARGYLPWLESRMTTSTPASRSALTRCWSSGRVPTAAPTSRRPYAGAV